MKDQCTILTANAFGLEEAATRIKDNLLVAFPTETVYGLGASALSDAAVESIFKTKKRPFTDPLIVHLAEASQALDLLALAGQELSIFKIISEEFWPGPLTIVAKASNAVSHYCTGGTGYLGVRVPCHPVALSLIRMASVPIAAPSANLFGHVSPTEAKHVYNDFKNENVLVLDGGRCVFGVESTVLRIDSGNSLSLLRRGAISASDIATILGKSGVLAKVTVVDRFLDASVCADAPGAGLKHYAPTIPAYILAKDIGDEGVSNTYSLSNVGFVDFGGKNSFLSKKCCCYFDLSPVGNAREACQQLFAVLRTLEEFPGVKCILLPDLKDNPEEFAKTLHDRMMRSSSKKIGVITADTVQVCV